MVRIKMKEVGPVNNLEMRLDNQLSIIIGKQASGKSTLAKEVYFCKKIRDYFIDYLLNEELVLAAPVNERYLSFLKYIRKLYMGSFGTTRHLPRGFNIEYEFGPEATISVMLDDAGYVKFKFSHKMEDEIQSAIETVHRIYNENGKSGGVDLYDSFSRSKKLREEIKAHFTPIAQKLFHDRSDIIYIPAGRSLLAVLSEQMDTVKGSEMDLPMRDFIARIREMKGTFNQKLDDVVSDFVKTTRGQIKNEDVRFAQELIQRILRAEYVKDTDGEKLYYDQNRWVKLIYGSSGQQESLWILLLLFYSILKNEKAYIILEEPEAHLFPNAQWEIMRLIALVINSNNSDFLVTTHSPYILTSTNVLLHSSLVENKERREDETIIHKKYRLRRGGTAAYYLEDGEQKALSDILDRDSGLINAERIDAVSTIINDYTDRLIDKELADDM